MKKQIVTVFQTHVVTK